VGFLAVTHGIGKTRYFRITRIVVLPDYQGIGIAKKLMTFIGEHYTKQGKLPLTMVTSNPQFLHSRIPNWIVTRKGRHSIHEGARQIRGLRHLPKSSSRNRVTISLKYVPSRKQINDEK
jgi:GNAT superfamily N-acetyltransferase